ncbi:LysM peptidoglycan-binding domain-containing protein [Emcibacter sp. SYSU 3D8]|uniref:LysM peptidoglycan-binding domain-containing protein n=1 Tax=Emcibacter sp. SYSU 3D8 TaxID=3133969 RepID=UPI0031FE70C8
MSIIYKAMGAAFAAALLSACASQQAAPPPPPPPPPPVAAPVEEAPVVAEPVFTATPDLTPRERFRKALKDLETGEAGQAKAELLQYLVDVPENNARAQALLSQIESPIEEYFPPENFTIVVGTGETMSTLAQTFLGDALKFYALARYNDIANPSQVSVGRTIKIPQTEQTLAAKDARDKGIVAKPAEPDAALAEDGSAAEPAADGKAPPAKAVPKGTMDKIRAMAASGDTEGAVKAIEANKIGAGLSSADSTFVADTYLASAKSLQGSNASVAGSRAQKAGELYLNMGDKPDKALEAAQLASTLNPSGAGTQKLLASAKSAAADRYYRNGLSAFRKQELDAAIKAWDKVLVIDPTHENAKLQRAQAVELKDKLSKLK